MTYIGVDNGTTSAGIGLVTSDRQAELIPLPVKKELSYTKVAKRITRINYDQLLQKFVEIERKYGNGQIIVAMERPMVNSARFNASLSAVRTLEATLIALEEMGWPYRYIDSKEWQKAMLPSGLVGSDALKAASLDVGRRLFPGLKFKKDADGMLIAEYLRRTNETTTYKNQKD